MGSLIIIKKALKPERRVKFDDSKKSLYTRLFMTDRSKAVDSMFFLFCVALWFILWVLHV